MTHSITARHVSHDDPSSDSRVAKQLDKRTKLLGTFWQPNLIDNFFVSCSLNNL